MDLQVELLKTSCIERSTLLKTNMDVGWHPERLFSPAEPWFSGMLHVRFQRGFQWQRNSGSSTSRPALEARQALGTSGSLPHHLRVWTSATQGAWTRDHAG